MAEEKAGVRGAVSGWIKGLLTSIVGLASGAFLMYLTPLVNSVIKPPKPIANFATQAPGLRVVFNNRSTGAVQGWWDFGDGSALEPFDPKAETVTHVYAKTGTYNVKLRLENLLGEESERAASVTIDKDTAPAPAWEAFELQPITPGDAVPAVYRLAGKAKNASQLILCYGDRRPMEILDGSVPQERYITFDEPGLYTVRLAAVNGKQLVEKAQTVSTRAGDSSAPTAKLRVVYDAVKLERIPRDWRIYCGWRADATDNVVAIRKERLAEPGCTIASAELVNATDATGAMRNLKLAIAPDKSKIILTGEMVKPTGLLTPKTAAPHYLAQVKAVMERRSAPQKVNRGHIAMPVYVGGTTRIPMQPLSAAWEVKSKTVTLELWDGSRKVWEGDQAAANVRVAVKNQSCLLTVTPQSDGFVVKLDPASGGAVTIPTTTPEPVGPVIRRTGFERNPLLPGKRP